METNTVALWSKHMLKIVAKFLGFAMLAITVVCAVSYVVGDVAYHKMFEPKEGISKG